MVESTRKTTKNETPAERVLAACEELRKTIDRPEGFPLEDLQAAAEYLLDTIKLAKRKLE